MKHRLLLLALSLLMPLCVMSQDMVSTPLTLEAVEAGTINIINPNTLTMEYNKNNGGWTASSANPISIAVAAGDVVQLRGDNETYINYDYGERPTNITATNPVYVYGNVMSLISSTAFATLKTLTDPTMWQAGANLAFLFTTPENPDSPFPKENTTILNHPTKDIVLPATTLTPNCYMYMFSGCAGLTRAPQLPSATLAEGCYHRLFDNCTSLETGPTLPARKLVMNCYSCMFAGCTSLNYVKCMATDISADMCLDYWMEGVPAGGTFVKASTNDSYTTGISGIPEGWQVQNATADDGDMGVTPFTMEAIADGTFTIVNPLGRTIRYKKNDGSWTSVKTNPITIDVVASDKVQYKAVNANYSNDGDPASSTHFSSSADCYVYGNMMSLINENTFTYNRELTASHAFAWLFASDDLMTPNTTLKNHPYNELVLPATTLTSSCYTGMFNGCQGITSAPVLPSTTLATFCYEDMFSGCTGLLEAPRLPATTLPTGCYTMMFHGCSSMEKAPVLPASIVPASCYDGMFSGCSSLNYVKCLATTLGSYATGNWLDGVAATGTFVKMSQMHDWPTGVDGIPAGWTVQAATEADGDYGASPLTLEAATAGTITISNPQGLAVSYEFRHGYNSNYRNNVTETTTTYEVEAGDMLILTGNNASYGNADPSLAYRISSTADIYVYGNVMSLVNSWNFANMTTLTGQENFACLFGSDNPADANTTIRSHPTKDLMLPATTLTESCYAMMFAGCQGLTRTPELPATTLAPVCYHRMFGGCTSLTTAPVLPATKLASECYFAMFDGCPKLNYVKCMATDLGEHNTDEWLNGVAAKGTFVKADGAAWALDSPNGIPAGWNTTDTPLTIEAIEDGTTVTITNPLNLGIEYSTDGGTTWTDGVTNPITISGIDAGGTVQLRGYNEAYSADGTAANSMGITADKDYYLYGNIMSLIDATDYASLTSLTGKYAFARLFRSSSHLKNHPTKNLLLPATTLSSNCYRYTFQNCTGLTEAPVLPATKMAEACYFATFIGCSNLKTAPELPSTSLATGCYTGMFANSGLTTAPVLPATELANNCYYQMFYGCKGLTTAPALPAMTVPRNGYNQMFYGCSNLAAIPELPATVVHSFGYNQMFRNCTSLTSYSGIAATTLIDDDGMQGMFMGCTNLETAGDLSVTTLGAQSCNYMFSGCTKLTKAPALPATKLATQCYQRMFDGCTSLVDAPALPATELADLCYNDMFWECTALKNAPVLPATTLVPYCYTMMFYGCSSLEKAPDLLVTDLPSGCYEHMFEGCTSLKYVKCMATTIEDDQCTAGWMNNVASTGTFVKAANMDAWSVGKDTNDEVSGIPEGWTQRNAYPVKVPASGICTFSAAEAVDMPSGLAAYTCSTFDGNANTISLQAVEGTVIPAATGVLLRGEAGALFAPEATADAAATIGTNMLVAVTTPTHVAPTSGSYTNFMLSNGTFVRIEDADASVKMPANKAYLQIPTASLGSSSRTVTLSWDNTTTAIEGVTDAEHRVADGIYDLQGRKTTPSAPGLYIVRGKKVYIK